MAQEIKLRTDNRAQVKVTGHVNFVTSPDLMVDGRAVRTTASTVYVGLGSPGSLSDIKQY